MIVDRSRETYIFVCALCNRKSTVFVIENVYNKNTQFFLCYSNIQALCSLVRFSSLLAYKIYTFFSSFTILYSRNDFTQVNLTHIAYIACSYIRFMIKKTIFFSFVPPLILLFVYILC